MWERASLAGLVDASGLVIHVLKKAGRSGRRKGGARWLGISWATDSIKCTRKVIKHLQGEKEGIVDSTACAQYGAPPQNSASPYTVDTVGSG